MTRARYIRMGAASGLSKKAVFLSTPGEVADLWELHLKDNGVKRRPEYE